MVVTDQPTSDEAGGAAPLALDVHATPGGARGALEAVLMVVEDPIADVDLAAALEMPVEEVRAHLRALEDEYAAAHRGFCLREAGGGWRFYSRADYAHVVERFVVGGQTARLTQAALETLAVVAYRQPISRSRIGAVRGVNVDGVVRTLLTRGLIEECGHDGEGGAILYGTTPYFLERMGLNTLDDLPPIAPYLPDAAVLDELVNEAR